MSDIFDNAVLRNYTGLLEDCFFVGDVIGPELFLDLLGDITLDFGQRRENNLDRQQHSAS